MSTKQKIQTPSIFEPPMHRADSKGKVVSLLIFTSYFTVLPEIIKLFWPFFIKFFNYDIYNIYWALVIITNIISFGTYNLVMYFIYKAKIPFFQKYRCNNKPFPWQNDKENWSKKLKKSLILVTFNMLVINSIMPILDQASAGGKLKYVYSMEMWPQSTTMMMQFLFFMFVEDVLFFWAHYLLHKPSLYWIHKVHHQYNITVTIAATSAHPLEYLFANAVPTGLGYSILAKFMPVHCITIIAWLTFRIVQTCDGHSGYDWSWGSMSFLPWKLDADYHNFHHEYNVGNFGSMFGFWDNLMSTNWEYRKYLQRLITKKQNAQKIQ